eukprot:g5900.t1
MASLAVERETGIDTESTSSDGEGNSEKDVAPPKYDKAQLLATIKMESEEEENAVVEMRKEDRYAEELLPQETIVRFLRARDHDLTKSKSMLDNHLKFRSKWIPLGLESCKPSVIMPALQSGCWAVGGLTKDGCPILYVDTNLWNPADYTVEIYVKYLCFFFERLHLVFPEDRHQVVIILDMSGWLFSDVFYLNYIRHLVDINQNQYPERLRYCNLVNVPWFFKTAWAVIKPWIDQKTVAKIELSSDTNTEKLLSIIDADVLSTRYGGNRDISNISKPGFPGIPSYVDRSSRLGNLDEVEPGETKNGSTGKAE